MVDVLQIRMKLYFTADIPIEKILSKTSMFLDMQLMQDENFAGLHKSNQYKNYCFDACYPVEADKVYKQGKIYTLTIRTLDAELAQYFASHAVNGYTKEMKPLAAEAKVIPQKHIELLYSLNPVIVKCENGYWRDSLSVGQYEERIKVNLIKKWNQFYGEKLSEDFELFSGIEFLNRAPVKCEYKNVHLLGDKLRLYVAENASAQNLAQLAVGTGLGEMNSRGMGMCNYRWL